MEQYLAWARKDRGFTRWNPVFAELTGSLLAGLVLARLVYWYTPTSGGASKLRVVRWGQTWLAKSTADLGREVGLTLGQARSAIETLRQQGYITTRPGMFNGKRIHHIQLNIDMLDAAFRDILQNASEDEAPPPGPTRPSPRDTEQWREYWTCIETILGGTVSAYLAEDAGSLFDDAANDRSLDVLMEIARRARNNTLAGKGRYGISYLRAGYTREVSRTARAYTRHALDGEQSAEGTSF